MIAHKLRSSIVRPLRQLAIPNVIRNIATRNFSAAALIPKPREESYDENYGNSSSSTAPPPLHDNNDNVIVYANPLCSKLDALILSATEVEDVLSKVVSHRGVFFVHNLVTALTQISGLIENKYSVEIEIDNDLKARRKKKENAAKESNVMSMKKSEVLKNDEDHVDPISARNFNKDLNLFLKDERYELLLKDLQENVKVLDLNAMGTIAASLKLLAHRCFPLFSAILRELRTRDLRETSSGEILNLLESFNWAGYYGAAEFYRKAAIEIVKELEVGNNNIDDSASENTIYEEDNHSLEEIAAKRANRLDVIIRSAKCFSNLDEYHGFLFAHLESGLLREMKKISELKRSLKDSDIPENFADNILPTLNLKQTVAIALAFSKHAQKRHDRVFDFVAEYLRLNLKNLKLQDLPDLLVIVKSFRKLALSYPEVTKRITEITAMHCKIHNSSLSSSRFLSVNDVAAITESCAYFGIFDNISESEKSGILKSLVRYAERHVDKLTEQGAIDLSYSVAAAKLVGTFKYEFALFYRKVALGTAWERQKSKIFSLWLSHLISFPFIEQGLSERAVMGGYRQWALENSGGKDRRRVEMKAEIKEILCSQTAYFNESEVETDFYIEDSPYVADLYLTKKRLAIVFSGEVPRNQKIRRAQNNSDSNSAGNMITPFTPCGNLLLQKIHLKTKGHNMAIIPMRRWRDMDDETKFALIDRIVHVNAGRRLGGSDGTRYIS